MENKKFINPFDAGVTYKDFIKAMGDVSLQEYCKGKLTDEQIAFLKTELSILKNK